VELAIRLVIPAAVLYYPLQIRSMLEAQMAVSQEMHVCAMSLLPMSVTVLGTSFGMLHLQSPSMRRR
jgi:hypothetical protein